MSGFIILSGFFANTGKTPGQFLKTWLGILAPYLVFESLYYLALSHLPASVPASNRLDPAFPAFWKALLLAPAGTYWYLYLLAVCLPVYYAVSRHSAPVPSRPGWPYAPPSWPPSPGSIRRSK